MGRIYYLQQFRYLLQVRSYPEAYHTVCEEPLGFSMGYTRISAATAAVTRIAPSGISPKS